MSVEVSNPFLLPLGTQRYHQALNYIKSLNPSFIIDFGCSECNFLFYLSRDPGDLQFSIGVDNNERTLLKGYRSMSVPSIFYSHMRSYPVYLVKEDITKLSENFLSKYKNCPFITVIEVIEHLSIEDVALFAEEIFGKLSPATVYLTTPNIEYNEILTKSFEKDRRYGMFRHADHKFEWNRAEFRDWCNKICEKYNYSGKIEGVGRCVDDDEKSVGFASHSVLFKKNNVPDELKNLKFSEPDSFLYKTEFKIKIEGEFDDDIVSYNANNDYDDNDSYSSDNENYYEEDKQDKIEE